ncbi:hypothetical protein BK816_04575 [Boudabousia tangfeifanii]|uniref:Phospholipid/glycerol acyltransferase domain-containing protein n=2 Tax=Boudabousia tangfeifanii TaxID=1912795 RepID=A0A1D9MJY5_9ACTO|nr:hypothetical protein BK816_04575 [Boudabousia tangfeifanii]
MGHQGDWDLAGAFFAAKYAPVLTVAENLNPPSLAKKFTDLRRDIGMEIILLEKGKSVFSTLVDKARKAPRLVPLLADRDLSGGGIVVPFCGTEALFAPGPAALAKRLDTSLYVVNMQLLELPPERRKIAKTKYGIKLIVNGPIERPRVTDNDLVVEWTKSWVKTWEAGIKLAPTDWHMTQAVFLPDLDPVRLAKARKRYQQNVGEN